MEKERYVYLVETNQLYDNEKDDLYAWNINNNKIINLLNQQDTRIKELEEQLSTATMYHGCDTLINELKQEIRQLKYDCAMYKSANHLINDVGIDKAREIMFQSEQKLKQSQNQKVIEVLEKLRDYFAIKDTNLNAYDIVADYGDILDWISDKIKELEDKNGK